MKTLYVSDMDGTLLNSNTELSAASIEALNRAIASGALFTVATARTPATLSGLLRKVDMRLPAIVMTGATTWNPADNSYSNTHHFAPETAREVLQLYRSHRLPTFVYTLRDKMINIYHLGPLALQEKDFIVNRLHSPYKKFHLTPLQQRQLECWQDENLPQNIDKIWEESFLNIPPRLSDAVLFFAMQPESIGIEVAQKLHNIPHINPVYYFDTIYPGNVMIEAFPEAATKAKALRSLADTLGVDRIVAFGDNINDIPMLKMADVAVAVDNAIPEVKEIADVVIGSNNDNAVAEYILQDHLASAGSQQILEF